jgi:hypothetical protein
MTIPAAMLQATVAQVAVDPIRKEMISTVSLFKSTNQTQYGYVVNHPYWQQSVSGKTMAVMGDCLDGSHFGSMYVTTGKKHTVGAARSNTKTAFVKGPDGVWRVQTIAYLLDVKC